MPSVHEDLSSRFADWEVEGRGWRTYPHPVRPEPRFKRSALEQPVSKAADDGRRPTLISSFVNGLRNRLIGSPDDTPTEREEALPVRLERNELRELSLVGPKNFSPSREAFGQLISTLGLCAEPLSFEFIATNGKVTVQIAVATDDSNMVRNQLAGFFPEVTIVEADGHLSSMLDDHGQHTLAVDFGLSREFFFPLQASKQEPFLPLLSALSGVQSAEMCVYQVLFEHVTNDWADEMLRSVAHADGKPLFINEPEYVSAAAKKTSSDLYAVVVRVLFATSTYPRLFELAKQVAGSMRVFNSVSGNSLIPLNNDTYEPEEHFEDVLLRQTRRSGMILNLEELIQLAHFPSAEVGSSALVRQTTKTKRAPASVISSTGLLLGTNKHASEDLPISLTPEHRVRHCHIIGASGTGKSTLLFNLIKQDIENGEGLAVLDPHGDLVDKILSVIPPSRINDLILVDPADEEYSIAFNILSAHTEHEKTLLSSDLVAVFQRLSTSWGDQMHSVLQNAIMAFLDSKRGGTLADVRRFLIEPAFRADFLDSVSDPNLLYYWQKGFPNLGGNRSIGPILTRLEMFLAQRPIARMVAQPTNKLDFGEIMDSGKILLAKLSEGLLGHENCYLLGALLVSKFQQLAMARQAKRIDTRRDFWVYIDEFANFITPSMAEILSGARKYRIGLTLAHHTLQQLQRTPDVAAAVLSHPQTRVVFRVGDDDARKLSEGFSFFDAEDFKNLEIGQAIVRTERSSFDFNLEVPAPGPTEGSETWVETVRQASRRNYGTPRQDVDAHLRRSIAPPEGPLSQKLKTRPEPTPALSGASPPVPEVQEVPVSRSLPHISKPAVTLPITSGKAVEANLVTTSSPSVVTPPAQTSPPARNEKTPPVAQDLGKGGAQHKAIQSRIKEAAEKLGFRASVEFPISGSSESIDLLLDRGTRHIACEISISTSVDHEVGNISKCLKAGAPDIAIICSEPKRVKKIEKAVMTSLGTAQAEKVRYFEPDTFISHLASLPAEPVIPSGPEKRRGYKIKRSVAALSPEEQKAQEKAIIASITDIMRSKKLGESK
jgi:hypothetical protein